jgi:glycosyltransferase involved in cell wall biosynthesis
VSLRLLHVVRSLRRETGGVAEAVRQLASAGQARGDQVTIVSLDPADRALEETSSRSFAFVVFGRKSRGYGYTPQFSRWLHEHASEFDAVIVHGLWQYQAFGTWRALRRTPTPYLVFCHGMLDVWFKRAHPLKHWKKWLYWPWADYRVLRDAAAVCFTADDEIRRAAQSFWLYRVTPRIVPIGIEPPPPLEPALVAPPIAGLARFEERGYLLFLGRIHRKKGVDVLVHSYLQARARLPALEGLIIAGPCDDEALRTELERVVHASEVADQVIWLPMLSGQAKWAAIRHCRAFVLLSHQENFGVAVVEAMACGRPVLVSDQVAIGNDIAQAGAGLVTTDDLAGGMKVLEQWSERSARDRAAMGVAAERLFQERYCATQAADRLAAVIASVAPTRYP